jgi:hypothetical protein
LLLALSPNSFLVSSVIHIHVNIASLNQDHIFGYHDINIHCNHNLVNLKY